MDYDLQCEGCRTSQGLRAVTGGIIKLQGDWIASHYAGTEGFLGWLALQPRFHRCAVSQLTDDELRALGPNIKALDMVLTNYWRFRYPADPVARVYVVYFFESECEQPPPSERFHLHIHVIARCQTIGDALRCEQDSSSWVDGWRTPRLTPEKKVPEPYDRSAEGWELRVSALMNYIRHELASRP